MSKLRAEQTLKWDVETTSGVTPQNIYLGADPDGLGSCEIAVCEVASAPSREALRDLFKKRKGNRNVTCLVVLAVKGEQSWIFGPDEQTQIIDTLSTSQALRLMQSALDEPTSLQAYTRLTANRRALETSGIAGFTNNGLFASYHIRTNANKRSDWAEQTKKSDSIRDLRHQELINALGFTTKSTVGNALVLSSPEDGPRAVAVLLDETEHFDAKSSKYQLSPVAWGLNVAAKQGVPWLIVLRKDQIRLYPGKDGVGVGNKGQVETFFEVNLTEIDDEHVALLSLVFSASALASGGSADELLKESQKYAAELGVKLRERIYEHVVPAIAISVSEQLPTLGLSKDAEGLATAYRLSLRILFRILFQAYGEDRGLLPAGRSEKYDANSLKTIAKRIQDQDPATFGESSSMWKDLTQVWDVIDRGAEDWHVPAYNGGLFGSDPEFHPEGALIERIRISDDVLGPALQHFIVDITEDGVLGPVDFRSLSVREFGTIYEGLLESSLSVTEIDLTVDKNGAWVPAVEGGRVDAPADSVYFHSASGERKATGSYFTPSFVVDHLIDRSLDPALDKHLEKIKAHLDAGDDGAAARDFFDFRVADLAMGSGHFLVAAVDRIESKMRSFLAEPGNNVPGVTEELLRLADAAKAALGKDEVAIGEIEPIGLLRRQVARRCIYGLDINPLAVELTRLALWIHTFVPGLPMSSLDHGLVCANSLTGIGTVEEAKDALQPRRIPGQRTNIDAPIEESLVAAERLLIEVANASESNKREVQLGLEKTNQAKALAKVAKDIFDLAVAARLGKATVDDLIDVQSLQERANTIEVQTAARDLKPAHMPYLFPEVFQRVNPGFDVLIGNPPWEELMVEEPTFWLNFRPGLLGLKAADMKSEIERLRVERPDLVLELQNQIRLVAEFRKVLLSGPYPGLGTGDIDLYQAFAWRNWQLLRSSGTSGLVYPRSLVSGLGTSIWRQSVFPNAEIAVTQLVNKAGWVFPSVTPQYNVVLLCLEKSEFPSGELRLEGPFSDLISMESKIGGVSLIDIKTLSASTEGIPLPSLPTPESIGVFKKIRNSTRFDDPIHGFGVSPVREFDATNDKKYFIFDSKDSKLSPVVGGKGFNLWDPDTGEYYALGDSQILDAALQEKRFNQARMSNSAFYNLDPQTLNDISTLPVKSARICFRDIARATDHRTVIVALVPPGTYLTNKAPYLYSQRITAKQEAFLLGVLSSIPLDWYAKRYVELGLNFHILKGLPVPFTAFETPIGKRIVEISGSLAAKDERFSVWASEIGERVVEHVSETVRNDLISELDALVAIAYGLDQIDITHIFETFHPSWNHISRLKSVLEHFDSWTGQK